MSLHPLTLRAQTDDYFLLKQYKRIINLLENGLDQPSHKKKK